MKRAILNEIDWRMLRPLRRFISWTDKYFAEPGDTRRGGYGLQSVMLPKERIVTRLAVAKALPLAWDRVEVAVHAGRGWCGAPVPFEIQANRQVA